MILYVLRSGLICGITIISFSFCPLFLSEKAFEANVILRIIFLKLLFVGPCRALPKTSEVAAGNAGSPKGPCSRTLGAKKCKQVEPFHYIVPPRHSHRPPPTDSFCVSVSLPHAHIFSYDSGTSAFHNCISDKKKKTTQLVNFQ